MVLKSVENRLERLFERTFSRSFKSGLQPVEIGTRIVREIDLARRISTQGAISPNLIRVWLGPEDAERFEGFQKALVTELEETVRQHAISEGYAFVGPVSVEIFIDDDVKVGQVEVKAEFEGGEAQPRLILSDGRTFAVGDEPLIIGRSPDVHVVINDSNVSRRHAEVWRTSEGVAIRDLDSTNGTFVNGHRISAVSLSPRDDVTIAALHLRIELA
ncbi:MAG: FHA domain-containing protein [Acidobacteriota bacterium]|nr:FHA domain-containing protein [Acidobacteriota bacterium]MDE3043610.1 FHA domain-containing protein [Acidobacteriota bacterium]MDE3106960.1 FHA domain-containing protein [Acidobacteriota bacterium]